MIAIRDTTYLYFYFNFITILYCVQGNLKLFPPSLPRRHRNAQIPVGGHGDRSHILRFQVVHIRFARAAGDDGRLLGCGLDPVDHGHLEIGRGHVIRKRHHVPALNAAGGKSQGGADHRRGAVHGQSLGHIRSRAHAAEAQQGDLLFHIQFPEHSDGIAQDGQIGRGRQLDPRRFDAAAAVQEQNVEPLFQSAGKKRGQVRPFQGEPQKLAGCEARDLVQAKAVLRYEDQPACIRVRTVAADNELEPWILPVRGALPAGGRLPTYPQPVDASAPARAD